MQLQNELQVAYAQEFYQVWHDCTPAINLRMALAGMHLQVHGLVRTDLTNARECRLYGINASVGGIWLPP